jgi:hypothetical protein
MDRGVATLVGPSIPRAPGAPRVFLDRRVYIDEANSGIPALTAFDFVRREEAKLVE